MANPAYLSMFDEQGKLISTGHQNKDNELAAEVLAFDYQVNVPADPNTGVLTSVRKHDTAMITKTLDAASPILFDACCRGKTLQKLIINWQRVSDHGDQEVYYIHKMSQVKVVSLRHYMANSKDQRNDQLGHQEQVGVRFEKIETYYPEGNIRAVDSWFGA